MNAMVTLLLALNAAAQGPAAPAPADAAKAFASKCAACHAKDGKGNASMAKMFKLKDAASLDLTGEATAQKTDAELAKAVAEGRGKMPSFKSKLKDAEISALVAYLRALSAAPAAPKAPKGSVQ